MLTASHTIVDTDGLGSMSYQWQASVTGTDGWIDIEGASGSTLTLTQAQVNQYVRAIASYTDGGGTVESVTSSTTSSIANINDLPTGSVAFSGTVAQGQMLVAEHALVDPDGLGTFAYRWQASADGSTGWTDIVGANMDVFTPTQAEVGQHLRLVVSYTDNLGGAELVFSAASIAVVNVNDTPTGTVSIMGPAIQGQTMTATNTLADADGMGIVGYQWQVSVIGDTDWSDIADAIGVSYTPEQGLVGKHVRVLGNYTDGAGTAESVASTATAVVNINDAPTLTTITPSPGASEDTGFHSPLTPPWRRRPTRPMWIWATP